MRTCGRHRSGGMCPPAATTCACQQPDEPWTATSHVARDNRSIARASHRAIPALTVRRSGPWEWPSGKLVRADDAPYLYERNFQDKSDRVSCLPREFVAGVWTHDTNGHPRRPICARDGGHPGRPQVAPRSARSSGHHIRVDPHALDHGGVKTSRSATSLSNARSRTRASLAATRGRSAAESLVRRRGRAHTILHVMAGSRARLRRDFGAARTHHLSRTATTICAPVCDIDIRA